MTDMPLYMLIYIWLTSLSIHMLMNIWTCFHVLANIIALFTCGCFSDSYANWRWGRGKEVCKSKMLREFSAGVCQLTYMPAPHWCLDQNLSAEQRMGNREFEYFKNCPKSVIKSVLTDGPCIFSEEMEAQSSLVSGDGLLSQNGFVYFREYVTSCLNTSKHQVLYQSLLSLKFWVTVIFHTIFMKLIWHSSYVPW